MFFEQLSNGLALGSIYALTAIGFTMVYGIIRLPIVLAFVVGMAGASLVGALVAKFAYSPVFQAPRINLFLSAIGVAIFLENYAMLAFGPETQAFPEVIKIQNYNLIGMRFNSLQIIIFSTAAVLVLLLTYVVKYTKLGRAMRCTSQDMDAARLMGINTNRIVFYTFAIGSALGSAAGALVGMYYKAVFPMMGFIPGLKAFIAAVIGGIGSIFGAMVGGLIMGVAESLGAGYISSGYRDAIAFVILIFILLVKPSGIFGTSIKEKV